jgi:uncharacterized repeat protein (TIGR01451 family)
MTLIGRHLQQSFSTVRRAGAAALRSLKATSASLGMGAGAHAQAASTVGAPSLNFSVAMRKACGTSLLAAVCWLGLGGAHPVQAATPPNTPITNIASATYSIAGTPVTVQGSVTVVTTSKTPATIEFMQYAGGLSNVPSGVITQENVQPTQCKKTGASYATLAAPVPAGHAALTVPSVQPLADARLYASGDVVFVRVVDYDQNTNPLVSEIIDITVTSSGGDSEQLRLTETGPSTGVFLGYIPSAAGAAKSGDCVFNIGGNQTVEATYIDRSESNVKVQASALIDPLGVVFDSVTGKPIDGVEVTLLQVDPATGSFAPAVIKGNDNVSSYPATVITGSTVVDSGGTKYPLGAGRYQFPRVGPGTYRLALAVPSGYAFPSTATDAALATLGSFVVVVGSRGENFRILPGPALEIDIPLDPADAASVSITKTADKSEAAVGEFVPYSLDIRSASKSAVVNVHVKDKLPQGFRYQKGSARLNGLALADPAISADGRELDFGIGTLPSTTSASSQVLVRYVAAVQAGTPMGMAENVAWVASGLKSNTARASVLVRDDLNRERIILAGRVTQVESCRDDEKDPKAIAPVPLQNVRIMLQDGTYVVTDAEGRWHIDNVRPGTHVVQIDETTMPKDFEYEACEQNTRTGGRNFSQFVNVRAGSLWRADFRYMKVASCMQQKIQVQGKSVQIDLAAPVANQSLSVTTMLPGLKVVAGSVTLDGKPYAQVEGGDGYLVVRLGRNATSWLHRLAFELDAVATTDITALVQLQPNKQPSQRLQSLVWKLGAAPTAQCAPIALPDPVAAAAQLKAEHEAQALAAAQAAGASLQLIEQLPYDDKWVAAAEPGTEWMHPQTGFVPALPVVKVALKHSPKDSVELKVNGAPVNQIRYEGMLNNPAGTVAVSNWRSVELKEGTNLLEMVVRDINGKVQLQERREIHYSIGPAKGVVDVAQSSLVADGRTAPVIAVRMFDRDNKPVRRGVRGEFMVASPYQPQTQADALQREQLTGQLAAKPRYDIGEDGIALIKLQPTTQAGEVVLNFDFGDDRKQELRVWLTPDLREWVLVGFAEGTLGHKALSGNMENLSANQADRQLFDQNRVAFYAKGQIKGEYLLTAAYDTAKERGSAGGQVLKQAVDPAKYYTLYADATQAQFDAASTSKLYLKIEKSQFYALFGDYDTGLSLTELGRYSRTLNGAKAEYKGEQVSYNAFASMTSQSFGKREIQGQGVSGLYHLGSRNVLLNTDKVRIETRDRLRPEIIVKSQDYTRYVDYQIDYAEGTLFFREPIPALDAALNPVYIVAEYESDSQADSKLTYGGRVATKVGEKSEVGVTHLHEGTVGRAATLTAADTTVPFSDQTKLHAEVAHSQRNGVDDTSSGSAYIVELTHTDKTQSGRAYLRKQDIGFGLGQQSSSATGTQKMGVDGQIKLSEEMQLRGTAYREEKESIDATAQRNVAEGRLQWGKVGVGLRTANEHDSAGQSTQSRQLVGNVAHEMLDKQLTLRASAELDIGGQSTVSSASSGTSTASISNAFPNRVQVGADYRLTTESTLFATHSLSWDDESRYNTSRLGLRTQPWTGGMLSTSLGNQSGLDGGRLYSDVGLVQKLKLNEEWSSDFGISRMQTVRGNSPTGASLESGGITGSGSGTASSGVGTSSEDTVGDYTAVYVGAAYKDKVWGANGRIELLNGSTSNKVNLLLGAQRNLENGRTLGAGFTYSAVHGSTYARKVDARGNYAYRPVDPLETDWMVLDRLEYVDEVQTSLLSRLLTRKLINNLNANWQPNRRTQVALQYSAKYVFDTIDQTSYKGYTDLMGVEARQDLSKCWDVGLNASVLHSWGANAHQYQLGVSTGFLVADNTWLVVGYNQLGFKDADFAGAQYRAKGLYVSLRAKFDQDSFNLNDRRNSTRAISP